MVFCMREETTSPTFSFLWPVGAWFVCCSAIVYFPFFLPVFAAGVSSGFSSRWRSVVSMRARSFFNWRSFFRPSVCPMVNWKRRRNICSRVSRSCSSRSLLSSSRILSAFISNSSVRAGRQLTKDHFGRYPQLLSREAQRLDGDLPGDSFHLEHDLAGPDDHHPLLRRALAFTHARFGGFLGNGLVRENPDPDFAAALDGTRHGDTGRFDLAVRDPTAPHRFQSVIAEGETRSTPGFAGHTSALLFSVLDFLRHQHGAKSPVLLIRLRLIRLCRLIRLRRLIRLCRLIRLRRLVQVRKLCSGLGGLRSFVLQLLLPGGLRGNERR